MAKNKKAVPDELPEEEDRPIRKKKKGKKGQGSATLAIVGGVAVFVVLLAVAGVSAFFWTRREPPAEAKQNLQAKVEDKEKKKDLGGEPAAPDKDKKEDKNKKDKNDKNDPQPEQPAKSDKTLQKGGKGIVQNVRGAVSRAERQSELTQLRLTFNQFCDENKGSGRTYENFLTHIKTFGPIRTYVVDGYYKMNMKARLDSDNIIAYERDEDNAGHLCVRANGAVDFVPAAQLKKELGLP